MVPGGKQKMKKDVYPDKVAWKRKRRKKRQMICMGIYFVTAIIMFCAGLFVGTKLFGNGNTAKNEKKTVPTSSKSSEEEGNPEEIIPSITKVENPNGTICLDAGHGFDDVGTTAGYIDKSEKEINLEIVMLLKEELESRNYQVILTHDGKTFPSEKKVMALCDKYNINYKSSKFQENNIFSAYERSIYSNIIDHDYDFDMFISLHVNSFEQEDISGYLIGYSDGKEDTPKCDILAENIKASLNTSFPDKNVKLKKDPYEDSYLVTKNSPKPAVLVEMGYSTNVDDAKNLQDDEWRIKFVKSMADAVEKSLNDWN